MKLLLIYKFVRVLCAALSLWVYVYFLVHSQTRSQGHQGAGNLLGWLRRKMLLRNLWCMKVSEVRTATKDPRMKRSMLLQILRYDASREWPQFYLLLIPHISLASVPWWNGSCCVTAPVEVLTVQISYPISVAKLKFEGRIGYRWSTYTDPTQKLLSNVIQHLILIQISHINLWNDEGVASCLTIKCIV